MAHGFTAGEEALMQAVLEMYQNIMAALQQHQSAVAAAQTELAKASGSDLEAEPCTSQQPHTGQETPIGLMDDVRADNGAAMLGHLADGVDQQKSVRSKRRRAESDEEDEMCPSKCPSDLTACQRLAAGMNACSTCCMRPVSYTCSRTQAAHTNVCSIG